MSVQNIIAVGETSGASGGVTGRNYRHEKSSGHNAEFNSEAAFLRGAHDHILGSLQPAITAASAD